MIGAVSACMYVSPDVRGALGAILALAMIGIAIVDARQFIIPDGLLLAALAPGLAFAFLDGADPPASAITFALLRGAALALAFWGLDRAYIRLRGRHGIGFGDVKLAAIAGVWLDWTFIALAVDTAALSALAVVASRAIRGDTITGQTKIPFGCFLAPAIWIGWFFQTCVSTFFP